MNLCNKCGALMWGENCTNAKCEEHYRTDDRVMSEMISEIERRYSLTRKYKREKKKYEH